MFNCTYQWTGKCFVDYLSSLLPLFPVYIIVIFVGLVVVIICCFSPDHKDLFMLTNFQGRIKILWCPKHLSLGAPSRVGPRKGRRSPFPEWGSEAKKINPNIAYFSAFLQAEMVSSAVAGL